MDELVFQRQIKKTWVETGKMNWRLVVVAEGCMRMSLALIDS